jgi:DNA-binding beta-propeller fold protein YncE
MAMSGCNVNEITDTDARVAADGAGAVQATLGFQGKMVIANRGSGSISALDAATGAMIGTFDLPAAANTPEPMYVVYVRRTNGVLVGDRANSRVVEFDARDFSLRRTAPTGAGVFHMWVDAVMNRQLWVNNDIDNTSTVIDPISFDVLATVPMPADLVAQGGKPHDVILDPKGAYAYVTMLGLAGPNDYVVQFETTGFTEVARAAVGKDPHVSLTRRNNLLYVPCQNSDVVFVLDRQTLMQVTTIAVPGAHGAGMTQSGRFFYTTNLPGGGGDALFTIDTGANVVFGDAVDAPFAVPHNLAVTTSGLRLFLTHSGGTSDKVTFYAVSAADPTPVLLGETTVGLNPFGLAYVP